MFPLHIGGWRPWQVLGGPGTGKTSLIVDAAVHRIRAGADPESVLVLAHSRRAAVAIREQITAALLAAGGDRPRASREPLVRTIHSYAFAVLRLQASAHGNPPPRLITGADQDAAIRDMLRGDIEDGAHDWPDRLRPALATFGFAAELRDFIMRAAERGLGPEDLVELGHKHDRDAWVAAGHFAARYEQATLLRASVGIHAPEATAPALDAAELVSAALDALATDIDLLNRERDRLRHILVDDAQHLDPQAAKLIRLVGTGADSVVIAGDPDQSVYGFRGADPSFLVGLAQRGDIHQVVLPTNYRAGAAVAEASKKILGRLPNSGPQRHWEIAATPEIDDDAVESTATVRLATSPAKEAAIVADTLRRAHLTDGVAWSNMAVIVRSVPASLAPLRRALLAAGVPVTTPTDEVPLARRHGVASLLLVVRAIIDRDYTTDDALALLSGPIGGAEPVALRRLRRGVRRGELEAGGDRESSDILRSIIVGNNEPVVTALTDIEAAPLRRVGRVIDRARKAFESGGGPEEVLWAVWRASGLEKRWAAASLRGGPIGAQADRDLDAVVALFDAAAGYVDRLPRGGVSGFIEYIANQEIPTLSRNQPLETDAVTILSAHAAAGREWDVVAVVGVQEGVWPSLRARSSLLGTGDLVDLVSGVSDLDPSTRLSRTAPLLAEERRLFLLACSRARRALLVTAVDAAGGDAELIRSRFIDELALDGAAADGDGSELPPEITEPPARILSLTALVAELRSVVCDLEAPDDQRERAAASLAKLAQAGVKAAHPDHWYGLADPSTVEPLWDPGGGPVKLSPSRIELLTRCPLRWLLERSGGKDGDNVHAAKGTLVHTLVQALAGNIDPREVDRALEKAWTTIDLGSPWFSRRELNRTRVMLETYQAWMAAT
ncbi:MAG: ATP-dependent helicase, partial [Rhodococcus sp.]|nr:ATP-dependent helicase [Rhodococcus sp. (in: high G+C Gram-positive bacteria)]